VASYQDFLSTQPPFFSKAEEPLDADAWLHTIDGYIFSAPSPHNDGYIFYRL
jgi:hypothetical protein